MKKRLFALLFTLFFCLSLGVPVLADQAEGFADLYYRVQDLGDLLTDQEEQKLCTRLDVLSQQHKLDIVVVTTHTLEGQSPRDYADDFYDYCSFGYGKNRDGVLLLISIEDRDWYISTCGYGITAFTDAGIQYIGEQMKEDLSAGNYADAFLTYCRLCDQFITQARAGNPFDTEDLPQEPLDLMWIPISLVVGFVLAFLVVGGMKARLKTVRFQAAASSYLKSGSLNITESRDLFLYSTLSRTEKPKNNSSGGSSTHTSSSGSTHGGGGGKF